MPVLSTASPYGPFSWAETAGPSSPLDPAVSVPAIVLIGEAVSSVPVVSAWGVLIVVPSPFTDRLLQTVAYRFQKVIGVSAWQDHFRMILVKRVDDGTSPLRTWREASSVRHQGARRPSCHPDPPARDRSAPLVRRPFVPSPPAAPSRGRPRTPVGSMLPPSRPQRPRSGGRSAGRPSPRYGTRPGRRGRMRRPRRTAARTYSSTSARPRLVSGRTASPRSCEPAPSTPDGRCRPARPYSVRPDEGRSASPDTGHEQNATVPSPAHKGWGLSGVSGTALPRVVPLFLRARRTAYARTVSVRGDALVPGAVRRFPCPDGWTWCTPRPAASSVPR